MPLVALLLVFLATTTLTPASAATTISSSPENNAYASNFGSDRQVSRLGWGVREVSGRGPGTWNIAVASAAGVRLRTMAVAFQVILRSDVLGPVRAYSQALADNRRCVMSCTTAAIAYQFEVASKATITLSSAANDALQRIHEQLAHLVNSAATSAELLGGVDALAARLHTALADNVTTEPGPNGGRWHAKPGTAPAITITVHRATA